MGGEYQVVHGAATVPCPGCHSCSSIAVSEQSVVTLGVKQKSENTINYMVTISKVRVGNHARAIDKAWIAFVLTFP